MVFQITRELSIYFGSTLVNFSITINIKNTPAIAFSFIKTKVVPNQSLGRPRPIVDLEALALAILT